jgi:hypothetical protein
MKDAVLIDEEADMSDLKQEDSALSELRSYKNDPSYMNAGHDFDWTMFLLGVVAQSYSLSADHFSAVVRAVLGTRFGLCSHRSCSLSCFRFFRVRSASENFLGAVSAGTKTICGVSLRRTDADHIIARPQGTHALPKFSSHVGSFCCCDTQSPAENPLRE